MMIVSIADGRANNLLHVPTEKVPCATLRDVYDVYTNDGQETVVASKYSAALGFAAEFVDGALKKNAENIKCMHRFMILDYDGGDPVEFARQLQLLRSRGGVFFHTTFSWTLDSPCARFGVGLDRDVTPDEYRRCWLGLSALLGGGRAIDPSTKDHTRGNFMWSRSPDRAPGQRAFYPGPAFSVDELLSLAANTATAKKPLSEGKFVLNEKEWRAVAKKCAKSKKERAQQALEFLEPALERNAWGGPGNRNESMMSAMLYAAVVFGARGIDVERSVEFFYPAVEAVKRDDPKAGTSVEELARTLRDRIAYLSNNQQEANKYSHFERDDVCAKAIAEANAHRIRYVHSRNSWHAWDGKQWVPETKGATVHVHNAIVAFSEKLFTDAEKLGDDGDGLRAQASRLQSAGGVRSMKEMLKDQEKLLAQPDDFDKDPMLLNLQNGVYDQRSHRLLPHDPKYMITKIAPVSFDPSAKCPRFDAFLRDISLGRDDWADYVMRVLGYCTTGDVSEHKFWLFTGDGRNGKGTLINTIFRLLGSDYAVKCASDMFTEKYVQKHAQEVMKLQSKRLAYISEVPKASAWDTMKLKAHSGGDILSGNRMRENDEQFEISHKILILANEAPSWDADDKALARRMKRVPFDLQIPEGQEDKGLEAALASELPGILNRLLGGLRKWQEIGFGPETEPQCVRDTTRAYREENDPLSAWLEDKCDIGPQNRATKADAWSSWQAFCHSSGLDGEIGSQISFGKRLTKRFQAVKGTAGVRCWQGFGLKGQISQLKTN